MLKLTDTAIDRLHYIAERNSKKYVRLGVKGGGCAGFEYEWSFADEEQRGDMVLKDILLVHRDYELYLLGTTLDWKEDTFKAEFTITNPNSKSSCGCGESFSL